MVSVGFLDVDEELDFGFIFLQSASMCSFSQRLIRSEAPANCVEQPSHGVRRRLSPVRKGVTTPGKQEDNLSYDTHLAAAKQGVKRSTEAMRSSR
jgi:hypothetical protein